VPNVSITIEGKRTKADTLFGAGATPLVGRTAILAALNFGIDGTGWLHG
jgi:hypothetical protein